MHRFGAQRLRSRPLDRRAMTLQNQPSDLLEVLRHNSASGRVWIVQRVQWSGRELLALADQFAWAGDERGRDGLGNVVSRQPASGWGLKAAGFAIRAAVCRSR